MVEQLPNTTYIFYVVDKKQELKLLNPVFTEDHYKQEALGSGFSLNVSKDVSLLLCSNHMLDNYKIDEKIDIVYNNQLFESSVLQKIPLIDVAVLDNKSAKIIGISYEQKFIDQDINNLFEGNLEVVKKNTKIQHCSYLKFLKITMMLDHGIITGYDQLKMIGYMNCFVGNCQSGGLISYYDEQSKQNYCAGLALRNSGCCQTISNSVFGQQMNNDFIYRTFGNFTPISLIIMALKLNKLI